MADTRTLGMPMNKARWSRLRYNQTTKDTNRRRITAHVTTEHVTATIAATGPWNDNWANVAMTRRDISTRRRDDGIRGSNNFHDRPQTITTAHVARDK